MEKISTYCPLCVSSCGAIATVDGGRLIALDPDPSHPTGQSLCAKGRAAPEFVHHIERLTTPLRRTRPKGEADPGFMPISWDEALDEIAARLGTIAKESGPEAVAFAVTTPSGTAIGDSSPWIERLINAFGSPNNCYSTELCNWHRDFAHAFTFGDGMAMPDFAQAGTIMLWGFNPSATWLAMAERVAAAKKRGAALIVIDPRRAGLAAKADLWAGLRPASDAALALGVAHQLMTRGWYDEPFVRAWTNAPLLVRGDKQQLVPACALDPSAAPGLLLAWNARRNTPIFYDPARGSYDAPVEDLSLSGEIRLNLSGQAVTCRPVFALYAERCAAFTPATVERETGVAATEVERFARLLHERRPLAYYVWSGLTGSGRATQIDRAIATLCALTGSVDAPGGNVRLTKVPSADVSAPGLMAPMQRAKALGHKARPLGPPSDGWITSRDLYDAVLHGKPYRIRALVGFGGNMLLSHPAPSRGAAALTALEFQVQADLFLTPTARYADIVLPVAAAFEREGLRFGFGLDDEANGLVQLRKPLVPPPGEARSDRWIVFALATRLGLGDHFFVGDMDAAYRYHLGPSGITLEALRARPEGVRVRLATRHRKYAALDEHGAALGFATPSRKIEFYSERLRKAGQDPLPDHAPLPRAPLAGNGAGYPLTLTSGKSPLYCHSQYRALPSLRRKRPDPQLSLHPATAAARGIAAGDWVVVESAVGAVRVRAKFDAHLDPTTVVGEHGWWQACDALGRAGFDPLAVAGANINGLIDDAFADPVSGAPAFRAYPCDVRKAG